MLYPFFELSSVALSYKGNSLTNPAGLGYGGNEVSILYQDSTILGFLAFFNTGIYFGRSGSSNFYGVSSGYNISGVYIGAGYDITSKSYNIGLLLRNYRFLSVGGVINITDGKANYSAGIGIRPYKEYITLYADALNIKRDAFNWKVGAYIQPFPYFGIRGEIRDNGEIFGGVELAYSRLRLGLFSPLKDIKKPSFGLLVSDKPFTKKVALKNYYYKTEVKSYTEDGREGLFGRGKTFYEFIMSVKEAADNPRVKTIFLNLTNFGLSGAQADELRKTLEYAKEKGKEIISFAEGYSLSSYYVASVGKVYMAPEGDLALLGPYAEVEFLKGTLDKLGIKVQVFRVGKYKSAVEPLIQDTLSEANREQLKRLLETTWDVWLDRVSKGRNIPRDSLENIIKNYGYLSGEEAVKFGLIDSLMYYDQIKNTLKGKRFKGEERVDKRVWKKDLPKIAIVVAEGGIVDGESSFSPIPIIGGKTVGSATIRKIFEEIRKDKSIKGVVLRVNSPGGSGLASDIMAREIKLTNKEKPVVVSMGGVAASGGYYISAPARKIFLDERTITGSIGVFGLKPVLGGFFSKIGMNREVVKLYPHSDAYSIWREMDSTELKRAQELVDYFYWRFVRHVAKGRNLREDSVHAVAQGRVWSGVDAVKIGLADEFGGILNAIEYIRKEAKIGDEYEVVIYPKEKGFFDKVKEMLKVGELDYKGLKVMYRMEYDLNLNF